MLILGVMTTVIMLYTSIRSGMTSMGRNLLAEKALRRRLIDILVTALGVLMVTAAVVYVTVTK